LESKKESDHWEEQDVGGWTILKWILEIGWNGVLKMSGFVFVTTAIMTRDRMG
jgi:hypothetical protein